MATDLTLDQRYWLDRRSQIIEALAAEGLAICSDKERVWLHRATPAPSTRTSGDAPTEAMKEAGAQALFLKDMHPDNASWEEKVGRVYIAMQAAAGVPCTMPEGEAWTQAEAIAAAHQSWIRWGALDDERGQDGEGKAMEQACTAYLLGEAAGDDLEPSYEKAFEAGWKARASLGDCEGSGTDGVSVAPGEPFGGKTLPPPGGEG